MSMQGPFHRQTLSQGMTNHEPKTSSGAVMRSSKGDRQDWTQFPYVGLLETQACLVFKRNPASFEAGAIIDLISEVP